MAKDPTSEVLHVKKMLQRRLRLPKYQRDFAWDTDKMIELWNDIMAHSESYKQFASSNKTSSFFLGTIVVETGDNEDYLVDGQQRFTTLTIMASAIRDALISTGYVDQAFNIDLSLLQNLKETHFNQKTYNRFQLLDNPPGKWLSSEQAIKGYRKRIVPIPLGIFTEETPAGSERISIATKGGAGKVNWSTHNQNWKFSLYSSSGQFTMEVDTPEGKEQIGVFETNGDDLFAGQYFPEICLKMPLPFSIPEGLEVVLEPDIVWPDDANNLQMPTSATARANLNGESGASICDLYDKKRRDFYFHVRSEAEHFILGERKMLTPSRLIAKKVKEIPLTLANNIYGSQLSWLGREPKKGDDIELEKEIPIAPPGIPEEEEILRLIEHQREVKGSETSTLELKSTVRYNLAEKKHEETGEVKKFSREELRELDAEEKPKWKKIPRDKRIEHQCVKTIAALMNTHGGALIVGVRDNGQIKGIEIDNFASYDEAERHITQIVKRDMNEYAALLVDPKVVEVDGVPVLYVHVKKWNHQSEQPPFCRDHKGVDKFYIRLGSITSSIHEDKKAIDRHISGHLREDSEEKPKTKIYRSWKIEKYSANHGRPKIKREPDETEEEEQTGLLDSDIPANSEFYIKYLVGGEWESHLDTEKKRAKQLEALLLKIKFSRVKFGGGASSAALDYFMKTNDAKTMKPLTAYDMASAFTMKIIKPDDDGVTNLHQTKIQQLWEELSNRIYIAAEKQAPVIKDFFYYYLMASKKWDGNTRWESSNAWTGLKKTLNSLVNDKGAFDHEALSEVYEEMNHYSKLFKTAYNPDNVDKSKKPYSDAERRDEWTYLKILSKAGIKQHITHYMALSYRCETHDKENRSVIVNGFLKNWVYVWIRYRTMAMLLSDVSPGWTDTDMHKRAVGEGKWIDKMDKYIGKTPSDKTKTTKKRIEEIIALPLELEPEEKGNWPWSIDDEISDRLSKVTHGYPYKKSHVGVLLYAFERASAQGTNPDMGHIHPPKKPQIEHILPEDPSLWGPDWYEGGKPTDLHQEWWQFLGNHCLLEDSKNSHVANYTFERKIPTGACKPCPTDAAGLSKETNHYEGTNFASAKLVIDHHNDGGEWDVDAMKGHSRKIMNTLFTFFNPNS